MNAVVEAILRRRSARDGFTEEAVPAGIVEDILRCGLSAPSSKNARPWRFHLVSDRRLLDELAGMVEHSEDIDTYVPSDPTTGKPRAEYSSTVIESAEVLRKARLAIFVENTGPFSGSRKALLEATPEALAASIVGYTLECVGVGAAVQNMWIAAVSHGLSGVFMGDVLIAQSAIRQRLSIASDLVGVLVLGYVDSAQARIDRADPLSDPSKVVWHDETLSRQANHRA